MRRLRLSAPFWLTVALLLSALPARAQETLQETVVVTDRIVYPGETVSADILQEVPFERGGRNLPPLAVVPGDVAGKVTTRTLLPGRLIPISALREPYAVEAGSPVQVMFIQSGLEISAVGVPLQSGSIGDMIRVRNLDSGAVFSGIVMEDGTIRVGS